MKTSLCLSALLVLSLAACGDAVEEAPPMEDTAASAGEAAPAETADAPLGGAPGASMLDPDVASREELTGIPGIDAATADALVAGRPYADMLAVDAVLAGRLDEEQRDSVYTHLWKPIDLNSASAEEILLIPGIGPRMLHEFEEYRPYRAIEEFRREMGKYVDDEEVARLERYVRVSDGGGPGA